MKNSPRKQVSATRWLGGIDDQIGNLIYGWALDTEMPDARVVLEVCLNGLVLTCVTADTLPHGVASKQFTAALAKCSPADHCHGFVVELDAADLGSQGVLTVRVANTQYELPGGVRVEPQESLRQPTSNMVWGDGGLRLHGWHVHPSGDPHKNTVYAYLDHVKVAEATANLQTPTTRSLDVGGHGFILDLPINLADGRLHAVRVVDGDGQPLVGSPVTVCCYASGAKNLLVCGDPNAHRLLEAVIDYFECVVPRSLGMDGYAKWADCFESPTCTNFAHRADGDDTGAVGQPVVAFVLTGEADVAGLDATIASLQAQTGVEVAIHASRGTGKRVKPFKDLLQKALDGKCDALACVRAGDILPPHAARCALDGLADARALLVYSDSERDGLPWFKPAWNPEYAWGTDYPLELMLVRTQTLRQCLDRNGLPENAAALAWQALAFAGKQGRSAIVHVPHVLYRFTSPLSEQEHTQRALAANEVLRVIEPTASLQPVSKTDATPFVPRRLRRMPARRPQDIPVSLLIPTRDHVDMLERCINSLERFTDWPGLEIIVMDNDSVQAKSRAYFRKIERAGHRVLACPGPFNFSALNNRAVKAATGEVVGLINNDIEALHAGWLEEMLSHLMCPGVGAVGAKLLWPNGMVQHGGVLLGVGNVAGHFGNLLADADWGDHGRNQLVQQVSAVTAACLLVRKADYLAVGGMDEVAFPVAFNDVDLCLKLRQMGKSIVWTPFARLLHAESASRGHEDTPQKKARAQREVEQLRQRWSGALLRDPFYHPSLNLDVHSHAFGGLALPPRDRSPRTADLVNGLAQPSKTP